MSRKEWLGWIVGGLIFVFLIVVRVVPRDRLVTIELTLPKLESREIVIMDSNQLREYIIVPTLEALAAFDERMNTSAAVELLMGTASQESRLGHYIVQLGGGPALGIYQMEPDTHQSIWDNYLIKPEKWELRKIMISMLVEDNYGDYPDEWEMVINLRYSTAMARIRYWYVPEALPEDIEGQAAYWKRYYNTEGGSGTIEEYLNRYEDLVK